MKKALILFVLLVSMPVFSFAQQGREASPQYLFYKAGRLYEEAKYEKAIAEYERIISKGVESGELYYNLGNSYFKKGELGKAILNYERARRLISRDGDLQSNYEYARSLIKQNSHTVQRVWFTAVTEKIFGLWTIDGLAVLLSFVYGFGICLLIGAIFFKGVRRRLPFSIVLLSIAFCLILYSFAGRVKIIDREAVVVVEEAEFKFEPFERATTHFTLYEGMKVMVVNKKDDWVKIERGDGKKGWVKGVAVEGI